MAAGAQDHGFSNAAAVLHGINDLRFEDFPLAPKPGEGMVRVEMKAVGICGSGMCLPFTRQRRSALKSYFLFSVLQPARIMYS